MVWGAIYYVKRCCRKKLVSVFSMQCCLFRDLDRWSRSCKTCSASRCHFRGTFLHRIYRFSCHENSCNEYVGNNLTRESYFSSEIVHATITILIQQLELRDQKANVYCTLIIFQSTGFDTASIVHYYRKWIGIAQHHYCTSIKLSKAYISRTVKHESLHGT